jgi:predicted outer membrane repeat protein
LTLTNGNYGTLGIPATDFSSSAGGVRIHKSALIYFNQVRFLGNKTIGDGGAIAADSSQQVFISNCRFLENHGRGGAIFFHRLGGEISACEFRQNRSPDKGAAIYLDNASPQISGNVIVGNESAAADAGGAIFCAGNSSPIIGGAAGQGNDIYNNTGGARGKALARPGSTPVIKATFNYFGNDSIGETLIYPLNGFDFSFSRKVPIVANGKPMVTQFSPPANQPLLASRSDTVKFQVSAYDPDNDLLNYTWTLDEGPVPVGYGAKYNFLPFHSGLGEHRIRVVVSDQKDTAAVHWKVLVSTTRVNDRAEMLLKTFALQQNFPNPLRNAEEMTVIPFQLPKQTEVILAIYDLLGRRVRLLEQSQKAAGFYQANWDGRDQHGGRVESGVYFIRMSAGEFTAMRKIVVMR